VLQLIFRALKRAGVQVRYSQGYNPSPRVSFSPALGLGMESLAEYFDMELDAPLLSADESLERLTDSLPPSIRVSSIVLTDGRVPEAYRFRYGIDLPHPMPADLAARIAAFLASPSWEIERRRKGRVKQLDIRPLVERMVLQGHRLEVDLLCYNAKAGTNPRELLTTVLGLSQEQALVSRITKLSCEQVSFA
jgi:radical SAM-linked protein